MLDETSSKEKALSEFLFAIQGSFTSENEDFREGILTTNEGTIIPAILSKCFSEIPSPSYVFAAIPTIDDGNVISKLILLENKSGLVLDKIQFQGKVLRVSKRKSSKHRFIISSKVSEAILDLVPEKNIVINKFKGVFILSRQEDKLLLRSFIPNPPQEKNTEASFKKSKKKKRKRIQKNKNWVSKLERITPESNTTTGKHKRAWHIK